MSLPFRRDAASARIGLFGSARDRRAARIRNRTACDRYLFWHYFGRESVLMPARGQALAGPGGHRYVRNQHISFVSNRSKQAAARRSQLAAQPADLDVDRPVE